MWTFTEFVESWGKIYCRTCADLLTNIFGTEFKAPQNPEETALSKSSPRPRGIVYLLKGGGHYKIGKTKDFAKRLDQIELQLPWPVEVIHKIETDDPDGIETYWHKRFSGKRKNGEWFELSDEDVAVFRSRFMM